jgi:hypothetical protein
MLNTFRLGIQRSSHYLGLFDESAIRLKNTGYGERSFPFPVAVATIGGDDDDRQFDVILKVRDGAVDHQSVDAARSVLSQITEMDEAARSLEPYIVDGKELDHDEVLARVVILGDEVRFRYFATTLNTEWDVAFDRGADGKWVCRGIATA